MPQFIVLLLFIFAISGLLFYLVTHIVEGDTVPLYTEPQMRGGLLVIMTLKYFRKGKFCQKDLSHSK